MNSYTDKIQENKKSLNVTQKRNNHNVAPESTRSSAVDQIQLQKIASNSQMVKQAVHLQEMANNNSSLSIQKKNIEEEELQMKAIPIQKQGVEEEELQMKAVPILKKGIEEEELLQGRFALPIQKKENNTGLPDNLKSGIENLSGYSMDDVKVHYNSDKPAQLQAHAYAQGKDIHIASGQEKYLPHEAWHVVQQKQGRVQPTVQMKGVNVNNDKGLENEADLMGFKASISGSGGVERNPAQLQSVKSNLSAPVLQAGGQLGKTARLTKKEIFGLPNEGQGGVYLTETEGAGGRHQQVRIGPSLESSYAQSFFGEGELTSDQLNPSISPARGVVGEEGSGIVKEDLWKPTRVVDFSPLTPEQQSKAIAALKKDVGYKAPYNLITNNCVHYSTKKFEEAKKLASDHDDVDLPQGLKFDDESTW